MAVGRDGRGVSVDERVGMGVRGAVWDGDAVLVGGRGRPESSELRWMRESLGRQADVAGGLILGERIWCARCSRERMGMGRGLLARRLPWSADGRKCEDEGKGLQSPGVAWRLVARLSEARAFREARRGPLRRPGQQRRFPSCQDVELSPESLVPCLLRGSRGQSPLATFLGVGTGAYGIGFPIELRSDRHDARLHVVANSMHVPMSFRPAAHSVAGALVEPARAVSGQPTCRRTVPSPSQSCRAAAMPSQQPARHSATLSPTFMTAFA